MDHGLFLEELSLSKKVPLVALEPFLAKIKVSRAKEIKELLFGTFSPWVLQNKKCVEPYIKTFGSVDPCLIFGYFVFPRIDSFFLNLKGKKLYHGSGIQKLYHNTKIAFVFLYFSGWVQLILGTEVRSCICYIFVLIELKAERIQISLWFLWGFISLDMSIGRLEK